MFSFLFKDFPDDRLKTASNVIHYQLGHINTRTHQKKLNETFTENKKEYLTKHQHNEKLDSTINQSEEKVKKFRLQT